MSVQVRFHKARMISAREAKQLIEAPSLSLNENVAIAHNEEWYDVRSMTARELDDFVGDLLRAEAAALRSGLTDPHSCHPPMGECNQRR